jgi:hypothetical protein
MDGVDRSVCCMGVLSFTFATLALGCATSGPEAGTSVSEVREAPGPSGQCTWLQSDEAAEQLYAVVDASFRFVEADGSRGVRIPGVVSARLAGAPGVIGEITIPFYNHVEHEEDGRTTVAMSILAPPGEDQQPLLQRLQDAMTHGVLTIGGAGPMGGWSFFGSPEMGVGCFFIGQPHACWFRNVTTFGPSAACP